MVVIILRNNVYFEDLKEKSNLKGIRNTHYKRWQRKGYDDPGYGDAYYRGRRF